MHIVSNLICYFKSVYSIQSYLVKWQFDTYCNIVLSDILKVKWHAVATHVH